MNLLTIGDPLDDIMKHLSIDNKQQLQATGSIGKRIVPKKLFAKAFYVDKKGNAVNFTSFKESLRSATVENTKRIQETLIKLQNEATIGDVVVYANSKKLNVSPNVIKLMNEFEIDYKVAFFTKQGKFVDAKFNEWEMFALPKSLHYLKPEFFKKIPFAQVRQVSFRPYPDGAVDVHYEDVNLKKPIKFAENGFIHNVIKTQQLYGKELKRGMKMHPYLYFYIDMY